MASFTFEEASQAPIQKNSFTFEEVAQPVRVAADSGFNEQMQGRGARFANIVQGANGYGRSPLNALYEGAGNLVGTGVDVLGQGLGLAYKGFKAAAPDERSPLFNVQGALTNAENTIGSVAAPYLQQYAQNIEAYRKQNPQAAATYEATRELGNLLPLKLPIVRGSLAEVAAPGGRALKNVIEPAVKNVSDKVLSKNIYPNSEEVRAASKSLYAKSRELGADFSPSVIEDVVKVGDELLPKGDVAKSIIKLDDADNFITDLKQQAGKQFTLDDFESIDRELGDKAHASFLNNPALSRKYSQLQGALRESVEKADNVVGNTEGVKTQREAVKLWSIASKMEDIERVLKDAQFYEKPDTAIKTGFRRIARNDKLMRGYTGSERKAIERAATTGSLDGIFKTFGSRLMAIAGASTGGVPGAMLGYGISESGRGIAEAIKKGQAGVITKQLGDRSGLVRKEDRTWLKNLKQRSN